MSKLQVGIYIGTIAIVLVVVLIFLGVIPGLRTINVRSTITIWGVHSEDVFQNAFAAWRDENRLVTLVYVQKNRENYISSLLEAIATGNTPDIIIVPDSLFHVTRNKLAPVPALFLTQREFNETYADIATIFVQNNVLYGIPLVIDPMVLYTNRDFFASEAIALPPATWDEFLTTAQTLTKRTADGTITRAGAAMGLTSNIPGSVDIISLLALQGGTSIIDPQTQTVTLRERQIQNQITVTPTETALRFYTDFARREKSSYTWNHTFPDPITAFARGDLAMFVGRASMFTTLSERSPHSAIGVSPAPQYSQAPVKIGYGTAWALAVPLQSRQQSMAWRVAKFLSEAEPARTIAAGMAIAPARRDVLAAGHSFPPFSVFYEEALRARTWYDPNPALSFPILETMIASVAAGRDAENAVDEAHNRLQNIIN